MKKNACMLLAALCALVLALAACGNSQTGSAASANTPSGTQRTAAASAAGAGGENDESGVSAAPIDDELAARFTPPNATVVTSADGQLMMTSTDSTAKLKAFYEGVLSELGAQEVETQELIGWTYEGTYDDGTPISISIIENPLDGGATRSITVIYK